VLPTATHLVEAAVLLLGLEDVQRAVAGPEEELHDARAALLDGAVVHALERVGDVVQHLLLLGDELLRLASSDLLEVVEVHWLAGHRHGLGARELLAQRLLAGRVVRGHAHPRRGRGPAAGGRVLRALEAHALARLALERLLQHGRRVLAGAGQRDGAGGGATGGGGRRAKGEGERWKWDGGKKGEQTGSMIGLERLGARN